MLAQLAYVLSLRIGLYACHEPLCRLYGEVLFVVLALSDE